MKYWRMGVLFLLLLALSMPVLAQPIASQQIFLPFVVNMDGAGALTQRPG